MEALRRVGFKRKQRVKANETAVLLTIFISKQ